MKTPPDKKIAMVFHSHPTKDVKMRWQAVVEFPAGASAETVLPISIVDGEGKKIKSAVFVFAGKELQVRNGETKMTFADFVAGKHSVPIWLHRKGMSPVPGVLTFA